MPSPWPKGFWQGGLWSCLWTVCRTRLRQPAGGLASINPFYLPMCDLAQNLIGRIGESNG